MVYEAHENGRQCEGEIELFMDGDTNFATIFDSGTKYYFCSSYDWDTIKKNKAGGEVNDLTE
jgi:hypothetical protein